MIIKKTDLAYKWYRGWKHRGGVAGIIWLAIIAAIVNIGIAVGWLTVLLLILGAIVVYIALFGLFRVLDYIETRFFKGNFGEVVHIYRNYRAAKTSKTCPIIEVEK